MSRNCEIRLKTSPEEMKKIKERAKNAGMKVSAYLRFCGLNVEIKVVQNNEKWKTIAVAPERRYFNENFKKRSLFEKIDSDFF